MNNQQKAAAALSRANQLKQEGKLDPALKNYLQAAELHPESFWSHYNIGEISAKQGKIEAAVAAYRRAIEIDPNHAWCHHFLGKIREKQGKTEEAIALYRRVIEIQPELSWSYHSLGNLLLEQGNIEEAVLACRQAVNLKPEVPAFCYGLAQALAAKGWKYEAAIAFFDAADKYNRENSLPAAIDSYQKACQFNGENAEYYQKLGILLAKQGNLKEAIDAYKQAIELKSSDDSSHSNLANSLFQQGELEEAITANSQAIAILNTKLADAYYHKTEILEKQGQIGRAIAACRQALYKKPYESQIHFKLGLLLAKNKQAELALKYYQEALRLQPEKANNYLELGKSLVKAGYLEQVISCHLDVFKDSTKIVSIYHKLAIFLAEQGRLDDAVKCFQGVPQLQSRKPLDPAQIYKLRQIPSTEEQIYENLWAALNQKDLSILDDTEDNYPREIDLEESAKHFDNNSEYRVVRTSAVSQTDKEFLAEVGLSLEHIQLMHKGNLVELEEIYIHSFEPDRNIQLSKTMTVSSWQQSILETGYIYLHCPITGKILRSNHSFYVDYKPWFPSFFYRFVGEEVFYLIIGSHMAGKLALYFPRLELIISYIQFGIDTPYPPLINRFKSYHAVQAIAEPPLELGAKREAVEVALGRPWVE
ncbi:MAG: tetratricopeptide repeat protein, partial [Okeania sp. SIO3B3]|nr:tetratricopeptide repeat protein [Okeania sp. SIO3B3]